MTMNDIKALNTTGADGREITLRDDQSLLQVRISSSVPPYASTLERAKATPWASAICAACRSVGWFASER